MTKLYLTNEDFSRMAQNLCAQLGKIQNRFQWVVGIERGGLPLSRWLSYALNKQHTSVNISFRDGNAPAIGDQRWYHFAQMFDGVPFLVVDDIVDSGKTIKFLKQVVRTDNMWVAALHWCPESSPDCKPDFFVETKHKDQWIVYPWEKDESTNTQ